jgi:hypothetical protein
MFPASELFLFITLGLFRQLFPLFSDTEELLSHLRSAGLSGTVATFLRFGQVFVLMEGKAEAALGFKKLLAL